MKILQNKEFIQKKGLANWMFELEDSARRYITEKNLKGKIDYKKLYHTVIEELSK